jgi:hypothetical protein
LTPNDFWELTPIEFDVIFSLHNRRKREEFRDSYRTDMERMRMQTLYLINVHLSKNNIIKTVEELIPFPWDKNSVANVEVTPFTEEEALYYEKKLQQPPIDTDKNLAEYLNRKKDI